MSKKKKVPVPINAVEARLISNLGFLQRSIEDYDAGSKDEVLRMAVSLRTLFHKTNNSHPLIEQVGLQDTLILSKCHIDEGNLISDFGLTMIRISDKGAEHIPVLNNGPNIRDKWITVEEWKNENILILRELHQEKRITRWDLVLALANQDGGAHSDPEGVAEDYFALAHENFGGFVSLNGVDESDIFDGEKASVRHMAWEAHVSVSEAWKKTVGKRGCECNSGLQYRYCCGKDV